MTISRRTMVAGLSAALIAGAAPRSAWAKTEADVVIIGAGLAGLHAAALLEKAGLNAIIVEASDRVGGRLRTLHDLPGAPEAGGIQIGSGYHRIRQLADQHGMGLIPAPVLDRNALYHVRGQSVTAKEWPTAEVNQCIGPERSVPPMALSQVFARQLPQLENSGAWLDASKDAMDISYAHALANAGASAEAVRLIGRNFNGNDMAQQSLIQSARSAAIYRESPGPLSMLSGGSEGLPRAMAEALKQAPRLHQRVSAIQENRGGAQITLDDGSKIRCRAILCTIPFSVLRGIKLDANLRPAQRAIINHLPYTKASFAYFQAKTAFWKEDGLPEILWSDDPLIGRIFVLGDDPAVLKLWLSGDDSNDLDAMSDEQISAAIIPKIEAARRSAKGQLSLLRSFSWQKQPYAQGTYHHLGVGQRAALADCVNGGGDRIFFAGEHLGRTSAGMEAALESAQGASDQIISKFS
jgi:monoamine oxidase